MINDCSNSLFSFELITINKMNYNYIRHKKNCTSLPMEFACPDGFRDYSPKESFGHRLLYSPDHVRFISYI
jgi:hypothetical protein